MVTRSTALVALLVTCSLALPSTSHGETPLGTIALVTIPGSQAQRSAADSVASRLAQELETLQVMPADRARLALRSAGGDAAMATATDRAEAAREALAAFDDLAGASRLLDEAATAYLDLLPLLETLDEPTRLLMGLATVALAQGDQQQLTEALQAAARLDPVFDLDPQEVSPRLARAAREAREAVNTQPVLSTASARRLGSQLSVDTVLLVQPHPDQREMLVEQYETATGARRASWHVGLGDSDLAAVTTALVPAVSPPLPAGDLALPAPNVAAAEAPETPEQPRQRRPWFRRWWVWTIIGAVIVGGGAAGIAVGVRSQNEPENLTMEVQGHW